MTKVPSLVERTALVYQGESIRRNKDGLLSLTDLWKACGENPNKRPSEWLRSSASRELVKVCEENMGNSHILKTSRGRNTGGAWAHPLIAVAYAKFLSPQFHVWANRVIIERIEESDDPELGIVRSRLRAIATWRSRGKSDGWIRQRLQGIDVRNSFTDALQAHGVIDIGYAICTDAIYKPVLGGSAKEQKIKRGLHPKDNLREHLTAVELSSIALSEALAEEAIETNDLRGNNECKDACECCGSAVVEAVEKARAPFKLSRA